MRSQQQCLLAIADAYRDLVERPFTMAEVAEWGEGRGLFPTPRRGSPREAFSEFEARLVEAKRRGLLPDDQSPQRLQAASFAAELVD